ncbi:methyltransferase family protein [Hyphomicrobium sulfonivorans]|uniref:methyltransferase family protein n=1 Tax=Hyphomicrobium sulfonivorans TaxID=121290 RepID=UPI001FECCEEB|nr:isoprenylcysteine carboxylmethyltransferase family protein [Hyphomicrobium sulfonivorans]
MSNSEPDNAATRQGTQPGQQPAEPPAEDALDSVEMQSDAEAQDDRDIELRPSSVPWPPLLLAGFAALAIILGYAAPVEWPGVDDTPARFIGLGIGVLGIVLVVWGIVTLRTHDTTMLPDVGATHLVTSGPFWRFRNPIYLGDAMILLGAAELTKNIWLVGAAAAFAALVTKLAIVPEERHLERRFGQAYLDYKSRSRRWI